MINNQNGKLNPNFRHGLRGTKFWTIRNHIKQRTENIKRLDYRRYGGRGIKCLRKDFIEFRDDMYESYLEHFKNNINNTEIDRIDSNGNYSKDNCRRVTRKENVRNRSNTKYLTYNGITMTVMERSINTGLKYSTIQTRLGLGWDIGKVLTVNVDRDEYYINKKNKKRM